LRMPTGGAWREEETGEEQVIVSWNGGGSGPVEASRQGFSISSNSGTIEFSAQHLHRAFVLRERGSPDLRQWFAVASERSWLCGVDLFSRATRTCVGPRVDDLAAEVEDWVGADLSPRPARGFGLEFEFVAALDPAGRGTIQDVAQCAQGVDPGAFAEWEFERDGSVKTLGTEDAAFLGAPASEKSGVPFEVKSSGPLSGEAGFRSTVRMLAGLRHMGVQAGPSSGLHVHVNVANAKAPGELLELDGVAAVWAAYAQHQLVINEMFSPGRVVSVEIRKYANPLFLGTCGLDNGDTNCQRNPCPCLRRIFHGLHAYVRKGRHFGARHAKSFCNRVFGGSWFSGSVCDERWPKERYFQLNLVPLGRLGTVEFRGHSATHSRERVARWAQFAVAFVEYFGRGKGKAQVLKRFFGNESADDDWAELQRAQQAATHDDLFNLEMSALMAADSKDFYRERMWEWAEPACWSPPKQVDGITNAQGQGVLKVARQAGTKYFEAKVGAPGSDA